MLEAVGDFTYFYLDIWIIMDYPKCYIEVFTGDFWVFAEPRIGPDQGATDKERRKK